MIKVVEHLPGGLAERPAQHPVLEEAARNFLDESEAEDVVGPDAADLQQVAGRSLQNAVKLLELPQRVLGRFLAVAPGGAERQEELDDLVVQERHEPALEELLAQPTAVPPAR